MGWKKLPAWIAVLAVAPALAADDTLHKEFQSLQGVWVVVAAEQDGQPLDRITGGTLTIRDQNFHILTKSGTDLKGDLRLDPAKQPKTMDFAHQEGPLADKTWEAIYQLEGDELKICYAVADSGKDRPGDFSTGPDSGRLLVVLKRAKR